MEAVRLRIEPAIDGLGIEVPTPLTADEAVENFFDPDFCSSLDLFRSATSELGRLRALDWGYLLGHALLCP